MSTNNPRNSQTKIFKSHRKQKLGPLFDRLAQESHSILRIKADPIEFPHRYQDPLDIEVVGFLSAVLAYGQVTLFKQVIEKLLALTDGRPYRYLMTFDLARESHRFEGIYYRFNRTIDFVSLFDLLSHAIKKHGSLGRLFMSLYRNDELDIGPSLSRFISALSGMHPKPMSRGLSYLLPLPDNGSACKRLNLYLRWMVRGNDGIDFGLWKEIPPAKLIVPLDTHIIRIAGYLKLCTRKSPDWKMAQEITESLQQFDPIDPLKYDFSLCHLGITGACPIQADNKKCNRCHLQPGCNRGQRFLRD